MKNSIKKILIIQFIMLLTIFLNFFWNNILNGYKSIFFLGLILLILIVIFGIDLKKSIKEKPVLTNILICVLAYFIITYIFGLFIGFNKTIYHFGLTNLFTNILPLFIQIILMELIRYQMINKSNKDKKVLVLSFVIFVFFEISISINLYNFNILEEIYEFIGLIVLTSISKNLFLTILCMNTDYINPIIYRIIMELYIFIVPIVPDFGPYMSSILSILFPILLSYVTIDIIKKTIIDKPKTKKCNKIIYESIIIIILLIVLLNSGIFKYQTLTIGSDSMRKYLYKGDVIVIEKLSKSEVKTIKKGDILIFKYDNKIISHRVYEKIKKNNKIYFRTKGDNNNQVDNNIVKINDVIGISKFRIKYIGLPSVWLKELLE